MSHNGDSEGGFCQVPIVHWQELSLFLWANTGTAGTHQPDRQQEQHRQDRPAGSNPSAQLPARLRVAVLASHPEADSRLRLAPCRGCWPWNSTVFQSLIDFLRSL